MVALSDGHDKPFYTEATTIKIVNFKEPKAIPVIEKVQFLPAISIIDKSLPIYIGVHFQCV